MGLIPQSKAQFEAALQDYAQEMRLGMDEAAIRGAGELCYAALELTPPMVKGGGKGLSKAARDAGYGAVERDIRSIFVALEDGKAANVGIALYKLKSAVKIEDRGRFERIRKQATLQKANLLNSITQKIIKDPDPDRAFSKAQNLFGMTNGAHIFEAVPEMEALKDRDYVTDLQGIHRKSKWVTSQGRMRVKNQQGSYLGKFVVQSKSVLEQYIKSVQKKVGFIKSGWWEVLSKLPKVRNKNVFKGSEIPAWIRRHSGTGYQTVTRNASGVQIIIGNSIGDNDNQASKNNVQEVARALAMARLFSQLEAYQKDQADKFNRGK